MMNVCFELHCPVSLKVLYKRGSNVACVPCCGGGELGNGNTL